MSAMKPPMVQRTAVRGISQQGRSATGVRVMNVREDDRVRAVALVVESEPDNGGNQQTELPTGDGAPVDGVAPDVAAASEVLTERDEGDARAADESAGRGEPDGGDGQV